jgi:hypothetical protein
MGWSAVSAPVTFILLGVSLPSPEKPTQVATRTPIPASVVETPPVLNLPSDVMPSQAPIEPVSVAAVAPRPAPIPTETNEDPVERRRRIREEAQRAIDSNNAWVEEIKKNEARLKAESEENARKAEAVRGEIQRLEAERAATALRIQQANSLEGQRAREAARKAEEAASAAAKRDAEEIQRNIAEKEAWDRRTLKRVQREEEAAARLKGTPNDPVCRDDLQCWAKKNLAAATVRCTAAVVRQAKWDHEWTDGWLEEKFDHFRWEDRRGGSLVYVGDHIKFQNGFGAKSNMIYACVYDPEKGQVTNVSVTAGRL